MDSFVFNFYHSLSGCAQPKATEKDTAIAAFKTACNDVKIKGQNLDNGPCLLNPIPEAEDWVCDVAHSPRTAVDNLVENQCSAYREGLAKHFVEVDTNCDLIREV